MKASVKTYRGFNKDFTESQFHQVAWSNGKWFAVKPSTYASVDDYEYADFSESELVAAPDEAAARDKSEKLHHAYTGGVKYNAPAI